MTVEHPADQPGPHPRRRQRPPDSRSHRRASAHGLHQGRPDRARSRASSSRHDDVLSLKFEDDAVVVQTARPDAFYARLTDLAASGELGDDPRGHLARRQPAGGVPVPGESDDRAAGLDVRAADAVVVGAARVFDLSLGQMLWSRRSVFLASCSAVRSCSRVAIRIVAAPTPFGASVDQRRAGRRTGDLRHDDLAALHPVHRPGARRVLRHGAHRRRSRRQDDYLPVHAADSARAPCCSASTSPIWCARCCWCCRRSCSCTSSIVPIGGGSIAEAFPVAAGRPRDAGARAGGLRRGVRAASAPGSSGRWSSGLVFAFGWEPAVLLFPGYLKRLTVAYYLQALVRTRCRRIRRSAC